MSKRSFSPSRLYKVVRTVVILITLLSIYVIYLGNKNSVEFNTEYLNDSDKCSNMFPSSERYKMSNDEWKVASKTIDSCYAGMPTSDLEIVKVNKNGMIIAFFVTIFLPLSFFGGTWIYKYVFPKK